MYHEGIYGNLKPDVPKVHIQTPDYSHSYFFGIGLPTLLKKLPIQVAAARIFGPLTVRVNAENTDSVEFFIYNTSKYVDTEAPFSWNLDATRGIHTLMVKATNDHNYSSLDIGDFHVFY